MTQPRAKHALLEHAVLLLAFLLVALCSHAVFLSQFGGGSFAAFNYVGGDATSQMVPAISLLENAVLSGDVFWNWQYGLGGDLYSEFAYYYSTSPFFYVMFLVKWLFGAAGGDFATTQMWRLIASIIKQTLCMYFMFCLCRQEKRTALFAGLAGVMYGCSFWFIDNSFAFDFMTDAMLWPPLIVMGYNRFMATGRPYALMISCALALANCFYFAYMTVLFLVIFAVIFAVPTRAEAPSGKLSCYLLRIGVLALIMLGAFALATVAFFPSAAAFLSADRVPQLVQYELLPSAELLALLPEILFYNFTPSSYMDLQTFAFPLAVLLVPFIAWRKASTPVKKQTVLAVVMVMLSVIPLASSLFNGMSYPSNRWLYLVIFAVAYAFPGWMETLLAQGRVKWPALLFVAVLVAAALFTQASRWEFSGEVTDYVFPPLEGDVLTHLVLGCLFVVALAVAQLLQKKAPARAGALGVVAVLFVAAAVVSMPFGPLRAVNDDCQHPGVERYENAAQLNAAFMGSEDTQAAYAQLAAVTKDEFFRVQDGETALNRVYDNAEARVENRSWLTGTYGTSAYNSMITKSLNQALKFDYAVTSTTLSASQYRGLGNRLLLENAWGVGYKLNTAEDANMPLYGYQMVQLPGGQWVLKNQYASGVDLWYTSALSTQEWQALSFGQKDALLLQAAVVDDPSVVGLPAYTGASAQANGAHYIDLTRNNVSFNGCEFEGTAQEGHLNASTDSSLTIALPALEGEYLLSFETQNTNEWGCSFVVNGTEYYLSAAESRWGYPQTLLCVSIPGNVGAVTIDLPWGYFPMRNCKLEAVPYANVAAWSQAVNAVSMQNLVVDGPRVSGTVHADERGILAINAPYGSGWQCTIDGAKANVLQVGDFFPGVVVEPGDHTIVFTYTNRVFVFSEAVSIIAVGLMILSLILLKHVETGQEKAARGSS